jgi:hypothetical protein
VMLVEREAMQTLSCKRSYLLIPSWETELLDIGVQPRNESNVL